MQSVKKRSLRKSFKVYAPFALNVVKQNMVYKGRFYLFILGKILGVFISYYLWMAIFNSSANAELGGFTRYEMITYIFMSYVASTIVYISVARDIGSDVVDGSIAMNLIKPIKYRTKLLATAIGTMIVHFFIPSVFIWIGLEVYRVVVLGLQVTSIVNILMFMASSLLSFLIYFLFDFCFGMLAFYTTYVWGMAIIKNAILRFLTGQLIPLTFFPEVAQRIFDFLPFASMNYIPVMVYLGKLSGNDIAFAFARQIIWAFALYLFSTFLWSRITKRLIVLGG